MKSLKPLLFALTLLFVLPFISQAQAPQEESRDKLPASLVAKATEDGWVQVIVNLDMGFKADGDLAPTEAADQQLRISEVQEGLLKQLSTANVTVNRQFQYVPGLALRVNAEGLQELAAAPEVKSIVEDEWRKVALAESISLIGADNAWEYGYTGAGWTVAVLDTGVDSSHSFLQGKVVSEACYSGTPGGTGIQTLCPNGQTSQTGAGAGRNCSLSISSGCEHGTHVAGIAAGKGSSFSGVARDANLIAIQVFTRINNRNICGNVNTCILSSDSSAISALERVYSLRNSYKIAAVNMSLGGGRYYSNCDNENVTYKAAIDNLRSVGIATVIATGNDGYPDSIAFPGCISSAISVGATNDFDRVADFSNMAYFVSLLAPGEAIYSSIPGGGFDNSDGTSMATPMVAGAWAIRKQINPSATIDDILAYFKRTGKTVTDPLSGLQFKRIQVDQEIPLPDMVLDATVNETEAVVGDTLIYTYRVENTGNVALTLSGSDNHASTFKFSPNPLSPGQTATAIIQYTLSRANLPGPYNTQTTITGQGGGLSVKKTVSGPVNLASLTLTRAARPNPAKVGETVSYSYQVVNNGSVTLNLTGRAEQSGQLSFNTTSLSAGRTATALGTYQMVQADLPGPIVNDVTVTGISARGTTVNLAAPSSIDITELLPLDPTLTTTQSITTAQNILAVEFPPESLPSTTTQLAYTKLGSPMRLPAVSAGLTFDTALNTNTPLLPLTFIIHYQESQLPSNVPEAELAVYYYDTTTQQWLIMSSAIIDTEANTVTFTSPNLGQYALTGHPYTQITYLPIVKN